MPAGVVHTGETLFGDPQLRAVGFFETIVHPEAGRHDYLGVAGRLSRTPGVIGRPAPCLGEHSEYVLREIVGLSRREYSALLRQGVTGIGARASSSPS